MRIVLQRVKQASVSVDNQIVGSIAAGMLLFLGVGKDDGPEDVKRLVEKVAELRIFEDPQGKMNLSIQEVGGQALVVSQFTLYADTSRGNRPSFINAALPEYASPLVDYFAASLASHGIPVQQGEFGAHIRAPVIGADENIVA